MPTIVTFGEALIDVYPDRSVVAGAPLHVAAHLAAQGWTSRLTTRLGDDADGQRVRRALETCGVSTALVETDAHVPTGTVTIDLDSPGDHTFTVHSPAAWDHIEGPASPPRCDVLYYGTLAGRAPTSRGTLGRLLLETGSAFRAFDVNLRPPDVDASLLRLGLVNATLLKVNRDELIDVAQSLGLPATVSAFFDAAPHLAWLCVTRGADGAELRSRDGGRWQVAAPQVDVIDTVGAGDAFTAGLIDVLGTGGDPDTALRTARDLAGSVLSSRGGLPPCAQGEP